MKDSLLILSGGLDSTVASYLAKKESRPTHSITFDYGQKALQKEIAAARFFSQQLEVTHSIIELTWLKKNFRNALTDKNRELPQFSMETLIQKEATLQSAAAVWIPNRNGIFLNMAAAVAEANHIDFLVTGFNHEEAETFPDNSESFVHASNLCFEFSTKNKIRILCPTLHMTKVEILAEAFSLNIERTRLWSCYENKETHCQKCESCLRTIRAYHDLGKEIPWEGL